MTMTSDRLPIVIPADWVPGPEQGEWTYKQYAALPNDGKRYEIVNGVLYMTPAPNIAHQDAVFEIASYIRAYVKVVNLGRVFIAPVDVELTPNMVVQPDVFVILNANHDKIKENRIIGAPDLIVEVVSPGTAIYDRHEKYNAYAYAGVQEYWIADPGTRTVEVLVLESGKYHSRGVFRGQALLPSQVLPTFSAHVEQFFS
ncbi:MAG TPA: Uma2 family endonuclease [Ktedonobacteraceae bacterium]|nr:Uma2 family endonuclease [Ktedonobacteraceae bacterium]